MSKASEQEASNGHVTRGPKLEERTSLLVYMDTSEKVFLKKHCKEIGLSQSHIMRLLLKKYQKAVESGTAPIDPLAI